MQEIWKDIKGYEGLYKVSNLGRIKSLKYWNGVYKRYYARERILKEHTDRCGYRIVSLSKEYKSRTMRVHRLIANAFIPNPNNYPCVNHIDGNKQNNDISNLEWCTYSYNIKEAHRLGLNHPRVKPIKVKQYDKQGNFIKEWDSIMEVERQLKIRSGNICSCCKKRKKYKSAGGYIWRYANE